MSLAGRYSNRRSRRSSKQHLEASSSSHETSNGPTRTDLFESLAEARNQQAWKVRYSDDDDESHMLLMFGETEAVIRNRFYQLSSETVEFETAKEW